MDVLCKWMYICKWVGRRREEEKEEDGMHSKREPTHRNVVGMKDSGGPEGRFQEEDAGGGRRRKEEGGGGRDAFKTRTHTPRSGGKNRVFD